MAALDPVNEGLHLSHDGCWGQSGGHIIGADVYDHQSPPVEPQACRVDVCRNVQNVLLNTRHVESGSTYTGSLQAAINSY
ncbi:hypothetical protein CgunFtcFv8_018392 [Champsocephalus gunnari]|uniref:Uncharacterized protein n=1 Tax=Champsocephalus gunnari TaxID=52237 RepID=A0AAN8BT88_CHAGU|nr:hypothetical protein CgunFtcFv8_018392 [Champsocephalus gunnari]